MPPSRVGKRDTLTRMTRQRAFTTAAARRRANPIEWVIDDHTVRLRASVDLTEIADMVEALEQPLPDNVNGIQAGAERKAVLISIVRTFVEPGSHGAFDVVAPDLDAVLLNEMLEDLVTEYTGQANPTQASPSSLGSSTTGPTSTDGAEPEA